MKRLMPLFALLLLVGAAGFIVYSTDQDPTGQATGQSPANLLWSDMSTYEGSFLKSYRGAFETEQPEPMEVLEAFNELGFAVTGHGGFWRKTVRDQWLGCQMNAEIAACKSLEKAFDELSDWDAFQEKISKVSDAGAKRFLARNHRKMRAYMTRYVPAEKSATSMEETGFYKSHLAEAMTSGLTMEDDDL
ncbi:MAG: hypothetical protein ACPGU1_13805 [Myxococcota bacterium]